MLDSYATIAKTGGYSAGVTIPKKILERLGLKEKDDVRIGIATFDNEDVIVIKKVNK